MHLLKRQMKSKRISKDDVDNDEDIEDYTEDEIEDRGQSEEIDDH